MSFKAKIIEDEEYYKLRRKLLLLTMFPVAPSFIPSIVMDNQYWLALPVFIISGCLTLIQWKLQKKFNGLIGNRKIVADQNKIEITNSKNKLLTSYNIAEMKSLELVTNFNMTHQTQKDIYKDVVKGQSRKHFITIRKEDERVHYNFEFDSYYMIEQLKKLVTQWETNGLNFFYRPNAKA